ncbi:MAG: hotdog fold thioesterase [Lentisphaeria bacterium]|nr:hotdog fold thioesterase [Lentisphaeria bacterium]
MDMENFKSLINEKDRFGKYNNMRVTEIRLGYAEAVLEISENSLNGLGTVQGGAIFSLSDLAFAAAANAGGVPTVAMTCSFSFIRPGTGTFLKAAAKEVSNGKRTVVYDVNVCNSADKLVAHGTINGFHVEGEPVQKR